MGNMAQQHKNFVKRAKREHAKRANSGIINGIVKASGGRLSASQAEAVMERNTQLRNYKRN